MGLFETIVLGVVQGITEFLPISSSGHLIIARELFGVETVSGLSFDAVLQLATSVAILAYFRKDFYRLFLSFFRWIGGKEVERADKTLIKGIVIGTIPAVIAGLFLEEYMDTIFRNPFLVAWMLILGSIIFLLAEKWGKQNKELSVKSALAIGLFQIIALIPGVSRSGITISGGLFSGLTRENAARFSFLLSFPILFGSGIKKLVDLGGSGAFETLGMPLAVGSITSFAVGIFMIHFLISYLRNHTLTVFALYRVLLAILVFLMM
jgi:undecaprenyl-diphosphatase